MSDAYTEIIIPLIKRKCLLKWNFNRNSEFFNLINIGFEMPLYLNLYHANRTDKDVAFPLSMRQRDVLADLITYLNIAKQSWMDLEVIRGV